MASRADERSATGATGGLTGLEYGDEIELKPVPLGPEEAAYLNIQRTAETLAWMLTRDSDVTRLLDRMEKMGLITRCREQRDRRVVTTCLTSDASGLLQKLDAPVARLMEGLLGGLGDRRLNMLSELLELARQNAT